MIRDSWEALKIGSAPSRQPESHDRLYKIEVSGEQEHNESKSEGRGFK